MKLKLSFSLIWLFLCLLFFYPVFLGSVPAPLDTIVGLYHPFRDVVWDGFTAGVPFKNFLITDPVRQQIPWRFLAIEGFKKGQLFQWNPYSFSGTPLTANIQTASFYPLNIILIILPFLPAWSLLVLLTPLLSGIFMYFYLKELKLQNESSAVGALAFSFSGFMIAWLEWGTIGHVLLWLPLILLVKEKLLSGFSLKWLAILAFSEISMFLAGHIQTSIYVAIFTSIYLLVRLVKQSNPLKKSFPFIINSVLVLLFIFPQYISFFQFLQLSSRNFDLPDWTVSSWFLPLQHLIQFIAPDFFGNPATLNYWGEWNYGEFVAYIGIIPLTLFIVGLIFSRRYLSTFYKIAVIIILILIIRNPISEIPFKLGIPILSSAAPTRLLSIFVFSLAVLSAYGLDYLILLKNKKFNKSLLLIYIIPLFIVVGLWLFTYLLNLQSVAKRNLILPALLICISILFLIIYTKTKLKFLIYVLILITFFDLFRFGHKFLSFSRSQWFYPKTETLEFLTSKNEPFRIMTMDRRIFAPNFSVMYKLQDVSGYDPLYLLRYSQLVNAWQNNTPIINPGRFNRIITPQNYDSFITDLLNVKYVLSLEELESDKLSLKLKEGQTRVYENTSVLPRAFLVGKIINVESDQEEMDALFKNQGQMLEIATSQDGIKVDNFPLTEGETVEISDYSENRIKVNTNTKAVRLLVLSDIFYPGWSVYIDDVSTKIYQVNYLFRGVVVPEGKHRVEFIYEIYLNRNS